MILIRSGLMVLFLLIGLIGLAHGQTFNDTFVGLGSNSDDPIEMQMDQFELNEETKQANLIGRVQVRQKNSVLQTARLTIFYEGDFGQNGIDKVSRMIAKGKVFVSSGDQTATSSAANFDMQMQILTMTGNVVLTKGKNVIQGDQLVVNLKTGKAQIKAPKGVSGGSGRVKILIMPRSLKKKEGNHR